MSAPAAQTSLILLSALRLLGRMVVYVFSLCEALVGFLGGGLCGMDRKLGTPAVCFWLALQLCKTAVMYSTGLSWLWVVPTVGFVMR
ncbi:hypothetical protein PTRG_07706 [Pyrenophora tritici-repentis Pt-1C-BFP]|uniref:Uncharacterized protein n=1 Tax=Pyrenophora tritici-repentis (strain Pt-1C-BFP) TaxID=426418 RepID=B2WCJ7_PYRTR|nr:uncharacterized protein PTRG_07706 [Pyrenophora tritici-repentis Pt-1C-BFP]EDU50625.1 hypothetical protein PTRG_07706 [Pyrenophora tritici-repentis Pt-1C-BFP]